MSDEQMDEHEVAGGPEDDVDDDDAESTAVDSAIDAALASTETATRVLGAVAVCLRDIARAFSPCGQFDTVQESIDELTKALSERAECDEEDLTT